jgi:hypothetical protein
MEGMISKEIIPIQEDYVKMGGSMMSIDKWTQGLVTKLLEVTHGQWLYRNVHVHDATAGIEATARKEEIQRFIEDQIELGEKGLGAQDHHLLEVNLEDLEMTTGDEQHLWLLQIQSARRERTLRAANPNSARGQRPNGGSRAQNFFSYTISCCARRHERLIAYFYPGTILEGESPLSPVVPDCDAVQVSHLRRMKTPNWLNWSR